MLGEDANCVIHTQQQDEVLARLREWADRKEPVRAMLLTSTRAAPQAAADRMSDYDVILAVHDILPFHTDRS